MRSDFSAVSLFSGAGGMDVGFEDAGFQVHFANDIDPVACQSYNLNHSVDSHCGDLRDFNETLNHFKGIDMVFGGPPCQGFSVAGKMDPNDERSQLIWTYLETVEALQPKAFVCENVKALAVNNRWANIRNEFLNRANRSGYVTAMIVLNASHFGVPQARERMFIVGIKNVGNTLTNQMLLSALQAELENKMKKPETIGDLIRRIGPAGSERNSRTCSAIITYAKKPVLRKSAYAGMLFNGAGRPINPKGVALTLPASMGGNKTPIVDEDEIFFNKESYVENYHQQLLSGCCPKVERAPNRLRRITVDEALAIQSFPSNYQLSGSQSAMYRQIGNAVPCLLAKVVGESTSKLMHDWSKLKRAA